MEGSQKTQVEKRRAVLRVCLYIFIVVVAINIASMIFDDDASAVGHITAYFNIILNVICALLTYNSLRKLDRRH